MSLVFPHAPPRVHSQGPTLERFPRLVNAWYGLVNSALARAQARCRVVWQQDIADLTNWLLHVLDVKDETENYAENDAENDVLELLIEFLTEFETFVWTDSTNSKVTSLVGPTSAYATTEERLTQPSKVVKAVYSFYNKTIAVLYARLDDDWVDNVELLGAPLDVETALFGKRERVEIANEMADIFRRIHDLVNIGLGTETVVGDTMLQPLVQPIMDALRKHNPFRVYKSLEEFDQYVELSLLYDGPDMLDRDLNDLRAVKACLQKSFDLLMTATLGDDPMDDEIVV